MWSNKSYFAVHHFFACGASIAYCLRAFIIQMRYFPYFLLHPVLFWGNLMSDTVQTHTVYNYCSVIWRGFIMCAICACDFCSLPVTRVLQAFFWQLCCVMLWLVKSFLQCLKLGPIHTYTQKLVCKSQSILWCILI